MRTNELANIIRCCTNNRRYAILKAMERGALNSNYIREYVGMEKSDFFYHFRKLCKYDVIKYSEATKCYSLSEKGRNAIRLIEGWMSEKFLAENQSEICRNDGNGNHEFIQVCKKCSMIRKPMEIKA